MPQIAAAVRSTFRTAALQIAQRIGLINWKLSLQHRSLADLAPCDGPTPLRIRANLKYPALQSAERRRNMLSAQCSATLNRRHTVASGQTRKKSRIEFPIV